jgi:type III secretion apparatus needle protein
MSGGGRLDFDYVMLEIGKVVQKREDDIAQMIKNAKAQDPNAGKTGYHRTDETQSGSNGLDNPATAADLQFQVQKWTSLLNVQSSMIKEVGDSLKGINQKMS